MAAKPVHLCQCEKCLKKQDHPDKKWHANINLLMSRLDEQQRRWYAAVEAQKLGYGGEHLLAQITGFDEKTIRRGRDELEQQLADRPDEKVRLSGAGRPAAEKKPLS